MLGCRSSLIKDTIFMMQEPVFSIIVPVFNTARYLPECLNSILCQNFCSYEIICIDNGSTDNSLQILDDYSRKYSRIKVLTELSQGVGHARNQALRIAKGQYIAFVDSDDYVSPDLLSECYKQTANQPDIIIFGAKTLNHNKLKRGQYSCKKFPDKFRTKDLFKFHTIAWNKVYKKSLINSGDIKFGTTRTGEDQIFTIKSLLLAKSINVLKEDLYIYRRNRKGSLTNSKIKKDLSPIITTYEIEIFLKENKTDYKLCEKILGKYILKSISWYGKSDNEFADKYFEELAGMLDFMKRRNGRYWWDYFILKKNCSYWQLKINFIYAYILYFLCEKFFVIPAGILFFTDVMLDLCKENKYDLPQIKSKSETLELLINSDYSICRFGDGEFKLILGEDIKFQRYSERLEEYLKKILVSSEPGILIGLPDKFGSLADFTKETAKYWKKFLLKRRNQVLALIDFEKQYVCAEVSRPYIEEKNKEKCKDFFRNLKKIWEKKNIVLVEGTYSRLGYNNDLFNNANSIKRIICPAENAFEIYDKILKTCQEYGKENLFIIALGPTATVLAYDLAKEGYRALDMGHIDIEYEWFLRGATKKVAIKNKYVNEAKKETIINEIQDKNFEKEILVDLTLLLREKQYD